MSVLLDTDLLSMLERKHVPPKLTAWLEEQNSALFVSVVSFAELQYGVNLAPATHQSSLVAWLEETRHRFAPATEQLSEAILLRWKQLLSDLKRKNRTMTCEDSLIAATALLRGYTIATHNIRHFEPASVPLIDPLL